MLEQVVPPGQIGDAIFDVDEIERTCSKDGSWSSISQPLSVGRVSPLESGRVSIFARKQCPGDEYFLSKKEDVQKRLLNILKYVRRFNDDFEDSLGVRMTGNIQGLGGYSLLHAAVSVVDDSGLVDGLLSLGSNPKLKSLSGETPLKLAATLFEKASENPDEAKITFREEQSQVVSEEDRKRVEKRKKRCSTCKRNLERLQNRVRLPDQGTSQEIPNSAGHGEGEVRNNIVNSTADVNGAKFKKNDLVDDNRKRIKGFDVLEWVVPRNAKLCWNLWNCPFYKLTRGCRFWHVQRVMVPPSEMTSCIPVESPLSNRDVVWKNDKERGLWTCAYQDYLRKIVICPKGGPVAPSDPEGLSWYRTRKEARDTLDRTVCVSRSGGPAGRRESWNGNGSDRGQRLWAVEAGSEQHSKPFRRHSQCPSNSLN